MSKLFQRIIDPQLKAESCLVAASRLIPEQVREGLVGDILEYCHERRQDGQGEWRLRAFVFRSCLSVIVVLWASVVSQRLIGMTLNGITKHPKSVKAFLLVALLIVVGRVAYTHLAVLANHNSLVVHMFATELLIEDGPDFELAMIEHVKMLRRYVGHIEEKSQGKLLRLLFPENTEPLRSVLSTFEQARPGKAREAIRKAGVALSQLYTNRKRYPTVPIKRQKSGSLSPSLSCDIDKARAMCEKYINEFRQHPTKKNATDLCRANRRAAVLTFIAAMEHHISDRIESFIQQAEEVVHIYTMSEVKAAAIREGWYDFLLRRTTEAEHRIRLLRAMLKNDLNEARNILMETIEHAEELNKILKSSKAEHPP